jgi:two-component system CheB/CheR fusion protein
MTGMPEESDGPEAPPSGTTHSSAPIVVGIGASAGGLAALKDFFQTVEPDTGLAFVVVVHLAAEHDSYLADLLQPHCSIPVRQVTEATPVEPNHVYVIPPGRNLTAVDSHLRLAPMTGTPFGRTPVDHFLRTMSETYDGSSIGVILSGTGSDGAQGIAYVREQGGLTIAQDPDEAEFDGMPRSAIDTGLVDYILPISGMVQRIREFATTQPMLQVRSYGARSGAPAEAESSDALQAALTLVRLRTGHDFLRYKRSTVSRRVARRMQVLNLVRVEDYVDRLRTDETEATALLDDLLINVTSFFRDADVFRTLETQVIPELFDGKGRGDAVRVWSVGCATGEEAYSLGMLLLEEAGRRPNPPQVQIFATDLHERSLEKGREALFTETIESEVSAERLDRFFRREGGGYRVTKALRDIVVFATHNLLRDPPFSRLDLVVCRNVLIYLQRDVQDDVIDLFHYSLRPSGRLLLGTAETLDRADLFRVESKETHLYRRRDVPRGIIRLASLALAPPIPRAQLLVPDAPIPPALPPQMTYASVHQRMVERYGAPSLLVGPGHEVVHLSDRAGRFLRHPGGQPTNDLFKVVREEFRMELRTAMHGVRERRDVWQSRPITITLDGGPHSIVLRASPASEPELEGLVLVVFDEVDLAPNHSNGGPVAADESIRELETELEMTRSRMQALIEEFETSQEEMRASNEELQSANEELRSTLEELETSREELQSVNEELQTLNQENRHKVEELSQLSSDLQNLFQSTDIATIFLDRNLRILRYTPRVSEIFNVRHTDRGRPLADLTHRLGYSGLMDDAKRVLQNLVPVEREVETAEHASNYLLRSAPYRTVEDRIEGVVITMVDITPLKRVQSALRATEERQALLIRLHDATRPINDPVELERVACMLLAEHLHASQVSVVPRDNARLPDFVVSDAATDKRLGDAQREAYRTANVGSLVRMTFETAGLEVRDERPREWTSDECLLIREAGERILAAIERAHTETTLRASEDRHRLIVEGAHDYAIMTMDLDGTLLTWSPGAEAVHGWAPVEVIGRPVDIIFTPEDRQNGVPEQERAQARATGAAADMRWHMRKNGTRVFIDGVMRSMTDGAGMTTGLLKIGQDVTNRRHMEEAVRLLNETLEQRVTERTDQLDAATRRVRDTELAFRRRLGAAEEEERKRLARDLHDEAGQLLTALGLGLQTISDLAPIDSELSQHAERLRDLAGNLGKELHAVAVRLRPKALDDFGLAVALQSYVEDWSSTSQISAEIHTRVDERRLPEAVQTTLYRMVQEALTNIARHSGATHVSVVLERRGGQVIAVIEDNGRGFDPAVLDDPARTAGLGLRGIRERAALLGGTVEIESGSGSGTTIFVRLPDGEQPV